MHDLDEVKLQIRLILVKLDNKSDYVFDEEILRYDNYVMQQDNLYHFLVELRPIKLSLINLCNNLLAQIDMDSPIITQFDTLKHVNTIIEALDQINLQLIDLNDSYFLDRSIIPNHLVDLYERFVVSPKNENDNIDSYNNEVLHLNKLKKSAMVSMIFGDVGAGVKFLKDLSSSYENNDNMLYFNMQKSEAPGGSLKITNKTGNCLLSLEGNNNFTNTSGVLSYIGEDGEIVVRQLGGSSEATCTLNVCTEFGENMQAIFSQKNYSKYSNQILLSQICGSIQVDQAGVLYYSPTESSIIHELIHGYHYSEGMYLDNFWVRNSKADLPGRGRVDNLIWGRTMEEYWTIMGGSYDNQYTENQHYFDLGLSCQRLGHCGFSTEIIKPTLKLIKKLGFTSSMKKLLKNHPNSLFYSANELLYGDGQRVANELEDKKQFIKGYKDSCEKLDNIPEIKLTDNMERYIRKSKLFTSLNHMLISYVDTLNSYISLANEEDISILEMLRELKQGLIDSIYYAAMDHSNSFGPTITSEIIKVFISKAIEPTAKLIEELEIDNINMDDYNHEFISTFLMELSDNFIDYDQYYDHDNIYQINPPN